MFFCARSERGAFLWNCQKNAFFAQCRYSASYSMRFKKFSNVSGTAALSTVLVSRTFSICFLTMSKMNFRARIQKFKYSKILIIVPKSEVSASGLQCTELAETF